jgi:hypothetical protein
MDAWYKDKNKSHFMHEYHYDNFINIQNTSYISTEHVKRIYAIGDIHGDYEAALVVLRDVCKVMAIKYDKRSKMPIYHWIAPPGTVVVILGDVVDRARGRQFKTPGEIPFEEIRILDMINTLAEQASQYASMVVRLIGNHEVMNMGGIKRDKASGAANAQAYATKYSVLNEFSKPKETYENGDNILYIRRSESFLGEDVDKTYQSLLLGCNPRIMFQIGCFLFMHAGISREAMDAFYNAKMDDYDDSLKNLSLADYANKTILELLQGAIPINALNRQLFEDPNTSLLWYRGYGLENTEYDSDLAKSNMMVYNLMNQLYSTENPDPVANFVVAHCTQFDKRTFEFGGVWVHDDAKVSENVIQYGPRIKNSINATSHGINLTKDKLVWRIDVGMSRAMDYKPHFPIYKRSGMVGAYCRARLPTALMIDYPSLDENPIVTTLVSRKPLTRTEVDPEDDHSKYLEC